MYIKEKVYKYLLKHATERTALGRKIANHSLTLHRAYENWNFDFHHNGEQHVVRIMGKEPSVKTIFDVGANIGEWSEMMLNALGGKDGGALHSFEIVPSTFDHLEKRLSERQSSFLHNVGMSSETGEIDVYVSEKNDLTSCVKGHVEEYHNRPSKVEKCQVVTGDEFSASKGIDQIDFLKLDVEGFEGRVLEGFNHMLKTGKIRVIQFEYGTPNIGARLLLKDLYETLTKHGMVIGKIYPEGVEFRDYNHIHENFYGANFIAIKEGEREIINTLKQF